ncbi:hypothetical protein SAMN05443549_101759 [Flavobacterium fluvii]|uniref:DUF3828 domain-containing protein n=1 Tax=Flavobacterium fluvii TaxID=468056 RepID=A0A1M5FF23_9FLAO|nr:hypothetical protein [Flavobacterium fluvii]SHF90105.1 hypothetical protein SAMN05443549_101759 [Flavobacterium fluvii]
MKTKIYMVIFMFGILFSNIIYSQEKQKENNSSDKEIVEMLKNFYREYITESDKMPVNDEKVELIKKKYCTSKLLKKMGLIEFDSDPFLDAQDIEPTLLKTIKFSKEKNSNTYKTSYLNTFNNKTVCVKLRIVKVNNTFKIDDIIGLK